MYGILLLSMSVYVFLLKRKNFYSVVFLFFSYTHSNTPQYVTSTQRMSISNGTNVKYLTKI